MSATLDWAAPIVPGKSLMGLEIGMPKQDVLRVLYSHKMNDGNTDGVIKFANSPLLLIDLEKHDAIFLRAKEMLNVNYSWQNELLRMIFKESKLASLIVTGREDMQYQGKIFDHIGLGSPVKELLPFCELEYDDSEECFYPSNIDSRLIVGGSGSCDLSIDMEQIISFIRIYQSFTGVDGPIHIQGSGYNKMAAEEVNRWAFIHKDNEGILKRKEVMDCAYDLGLYRWISYVANM